MALIECKNLILGYEGRRVIEDLNFRVDKGQYLYIIGENGAGKSTLMKSILGLHKPSDGQINFGDNLKQKEIGYIPQHRNIQNDFPVTIMEVVLSGCLNRHGKIAIYSKEDKKNALDNLEKLGIRNLKNKCYRELSGGQQQRVLMARALCATKKVLFLDEPMSGVDTETSRELYSILKELNRQGVTILMISHDLDTLYDNASHVLHLAKDKMFWGTVEEYKYA